MQDAGWSSFWSQSQHCSNMFQPVSIYWVPGASTNSKKPSRKSNCSVFCHMISLRQWTGFCNCSSVGGYSKREPTLASNHKILVSYSHGSSYQASMRAGHGGFGTPGTRSIRLRHEDFKINRPLGELCNLECRIFGTTSRDFSARLLQTLHCRSTQGDVASIGDELHLWLKVYSAWCPILLLCAAAARSNETR